MIAQCGAKSKFRAVSHVIFDMDGTLIDAEGVYKDTIGKIAKRFGKEYSPDVIAKVAGRVERESARMAVTEMKLPMSIDEFQTEFRTNANLHFKTYGAPLMPGAEKIVRHLSQNNVPISVATSSTQETFELKAANHKDLFKLFDHIVCGGDDPEVKQGKPAPDIFLISAGRFPDKPNPEKCLVIEDNPNGVQAALKAGMQVVMVPDENIPKELRKDATVIVTSLDLVPLEKFGLPSRK